jgi:hypothetical protein
MSFRRRRYSTDDEFTYNDNNDESDDDYDEDDYVDDDFTHELLEGDSLSQDTRENLLTLSNITEADIEALNMADNLEQDAEADPNDEPDPDADANDNAQLDVEATTGGADPDPNYDPDYDPDQDKLTPIECIEKAKAMITVRDFSSARTRYAKLWDYWKAAEVTVDLTETSFEAEIEKLKQYDVEAAVEFMKAPT